MDWSNMDKFYAGRNRVGTYKFAANIQDLINDDEFGNQITTIRVEELMTSESMYVNMWHSNEMASLAKDWLFFHQITDLGSND